MSNIARFAGSLATRAAAVAASLLLTTGLAAAQSSPQAAPAPPPPAQYDAALAQRVGANDMGMRSYVLVILKSSATPVPKGPERDEMFRGHFANMKRLADAGQLVFAGPLDGVEGRRGIFILAVPDIEQARALVATDPVIIKGEMVPELHRLFGSAALMLVNETHAKISKRAP